MPETNPQQISFGGGVNAVAPAHLIGEDQVQTATNIDFSIERGAASVRRGSVLHQVVGTDTVDFVFANYNNDSLQSTPYYFITSNGVSRGLGTGSATLTSIASNTNIFGAATGYGVFRDNVFFGFAAATDNIMDNGTSPIEWIKQSPSAAPNVTIATATPLNVATAYALSEGTLVGTDTSTITATTDAGTFRVAFWATPTTTALDTISSVAVGDYGVDHLQIKFSNPSVVTRVSRDYSLNGTTFANYWHTEMAMNLSEFLDMDVTGYTKDDALPDSSVLVNSELNVGISTDTNVDLDDRVGMVSTARRSIRAPKMRISAAANEFNDWAVPRTKFEYVGAAFAPTGWGTCSRVRVIVECDDACTVSLGAWTLQGDTAHPISDAEVGVAYWETFATMDTNTDSPTYNAKIAESAPSPASARVKCQNVAGVVTSTNTTTGTVHGLTHRIIYRQGGYLADAYAVATIAIATATVTDTVADVKALSLNNRLNRNILTRSAFPGNCRAISSAFKERLFVGYDNQIRWSLPGMPNSFPVTSRAQMSNYGDNVMGLFVESPTLVVVNRDSIYEVQGNNFEGRDADYIVYRTAARTGSKAPKTLIRTPYGIFLLTYDGMSLYQPGQGTDQSITWAMEKMADVFRGENSWDLPAIKGSRIPAVNLGAINISCAAFADDKLYLAMPCGASQVTNNYVFVLDARTEQVWVNKYPWSISALWWDFQLNRLFAGTTNGKIMQLETKGYDTLTTGTATAIDYSFVSRAVTTPQDLVLENISVEHRGGTSTVFGIYDGTSTTTLGTLTNTSSKDWLTPAMSGTVTNNVAFKFVGTQAYTTNLTTTDTHYQQSIYNIQWDSLVEPKRVTYWRTEHDVNNWDGEKIWDVHFADIEKCLTGTATTGTITAVIYVDNVAVKTASYIGAAGREIYPTSIPVNSVGDVAYTVYTAGSGIQFKHWKTSFVARNEPPRISAYKTDIESLEENMCDAVDVDIDPNGTVTSTVYVDNTAVGTYTWSGTGRQSYTHSFTATSATPWGLYGRTLFAIHNGTNFKHYRTWFHLRQEPDRWDTFRTDMESLEENSCDGMDVDIDPRGTVLSTVYVDSTAVGTYTSSGTGRQSYTYALPGGTTAPHGLYGRTLFCIHNGTGFKHYKTWFHLRPEPDRWTNYLSDRQSENEQFWQTFECDIDPLGGTVYATVVVDNTAVGTFTMTGNGRQSYPFAIAEDSYGRTIYSTYTCSGAGKFKHYRTWFEGTPEPDRLSFVQVGPKMYPSDQNLRTWMADLNPLGTCSGVLYIDNVAVSTETFTGTKRQVYRVGLDVTSALALRTAAYELDIVYYAIGTGARMKHYDTQFETEPKPFGKKTWSIIYKKVGGATQLDLARFWSFDIETPNAGTATITAAWDLDGEEFQIGTFTTTGSRWRDRIPFEPGARGYLFQQRLYSNTPVHVWKSNIDIMRVGVKGLSRLTIPGTPQGNG